MGGVGGGRCQASKSEVGRRARRHHQTHHASASRKSLSSRRRHPSRQQQRMHSAANNRANRDASLPSAKAIERNANHRGSRGNSDSNGSRGDISASAVNSSDSNQVNANRAHGRGANDPTAISVSSAQDSQALRQLSTSQAASSRDSIVSKQSTTSSIDKDHSRRQSNTRSESLSSLISQIRGSQYRRTRRSRATTS